MLQIKGNTLILDAEASKNLKRIIENPDAKQAERRRELINHILQNRNSYTKNNETCIPIEEKSISSYSFTATVKCCQSFWSLYESINNAYNSLLTSALTVKMDTTEKITTEIVGQISTSDSIANSAA